ncbi:hypothetical protein PS631_04980 [Pseudomonas fluorescens]|uniref:Uncharacterized protein n=1 Tax=Pseudomonas fluorescens TaxID=294 RepID=A0A5E6WU39_PSEFL|nr:hypothetical protein PS631_04980 [Pseudomonas fluorescens]
MISTQHGQPAIHAQPLVIFIAIAHTGHGLCWQGYLGIYGKLGKQNGAQRRGFFFTAHADDSAALQVQRRQTQHGDKQGLIRVDNPTANNSGVTGMNDAPLDKAVTAIELKNHHATSG